MPERIDVTSTRGRLWTPIAKSWPVKSRSETCPLTKATRVRHRRIPIPPACRATVAPTPPMARTRPGGVFIIISILCKSECHRAAYTEPDPARRRTMAKRTPLPQPVVGYAAARAAATHGGVRGERSDQGFRGFLGRGLERRAHRGVPRRAHPVAFLE